MSREIYCLCETSENDYITGKDVVVAIVPMKCIKTGARRVLEDNSPHYPNVDVFECPSCGNRVAR